MFHMINCKFNLVSYHIIFLWIHIFGKTKHLEYRIIFLDFECFDLNLLFRVMIYNIINITVT